MHRAAVRSVVVLSVFAVLAGGCRSAAPAGSAEYPFDRTGGQDEMGLIKNPVWTAVEAGQSPCTLDPERCNTRRPGAGCTAEFLGIDHSAKRPWYEWLLPWKWGRATCIAWNPKLPGHLNLDDATIEGFLGYKGMAFDGDYDFELQPLNGAALTANNPTHVMLEFSSRETLNQFEQLPPWWGELAATALSERDASVVNSLLTRDTSSQSPPFAIATGLLGLDCVHACTAELHPVYALAIRTADDGKTEHWKILVRNWGTEGWCGRLTHELPLEEVRILLPNASATAESSIEGSFRAYNAVKPVARNVFRFLFRPKKKHESVAAFGKAELTTRGYLLSFRLDPASEKSTIVGEVVVRWATQKTKTETPPAMACSTAEPKRDDPEASYERLMAASPRDEQLKALREIAVSGNSATQGRVTTLKQTDQVLAEYAPPIAETITVTSDSLRDESVRPRGSFDTAKQKEIGRALALICGNKDVDRTSPDYIKLCGSGGR